MKSYKIKDSFKANNSKLLGFVGELFDKMIYNRMTSDFAVESILAEAEEPFFSKSDDDDAPLGWWRGEFWGKWMISAVRACKYSPSRKLSEIIRNSAEKVISTATDDGYIGTYKNPALIFPCTEAEGKAVVGFNCNFCWNIWCRKYTLWGLIEAYELLNDEKFLNAAYALALNTIETVHASGANPCETGTFLGVASGSIMKPMLILYGHVGDDRLLDFAKEIADGFENDDAKCIKIIKKSLEFVPVHVWNYDNPAAETPFNYTSQKAYEMMSCFEGICELYRYTGTEKYLTAVKNFHELIMRYEYNRLMCVGYNDRFLHASVIEDAVSEPCDIIHFIRLSFELYLITGDGKYAQCIEDAFINPFLSSINRNGDWGARIVRSMSHHVEERDIVNMKYNHCCVNNMPRAFATAAEFMVLKDEDGYIINSYLPFRAELDEGVVSVSEGYVSECAVTVSFNLEKATAFKFRIPKWSKKTKITVGGKEYAPIEGSFLSVPVSSGKTNVRIELDSTPRLIPGDYLRYMFPMTQYLKKRYDLISPAEATKDNMSTLHIGPVLLSMWDGLGTEWSEMTDSKPVCRDAYITAERVPAEGTQVCYKVRIKSEKEDRCIFMCDYVSASNEFLPKRFSIFI